MSADFLLGSAVAYPHITLDHKLKCQLEPHAAVCTRAKSRGASQFQLTTCIALLFGLALTT